MKGIPARSHDGGIRSCVASRHRVRKSLPQKRFAVAAGMRRVIGDGRSWRADAGRDLQLAHVHASRRSVRVARCAAGRPMLELTPVVNIELRPGQFVPPLAASRWSRPRSRGEDARAPRRGRSSRSFGFDSFEYGVSPTPRPDRHGVELRLHDGAASGRGTTTAWATSRSTRASSSRAGARSR